MGREEEDVKSRSNSNEMAQLQSSRISHAVADLPGYMNDKFGEVQLNAQSNRIAENTSTSASFAQSQSRSHIEAEEKVDLDSTDVMLMHSVNDLDLSALPKQTAGNDQHVDDTESFEDKIRSIVREEVEQSEQRVLSKMCEMMSQLHSDMVDQFITNETSSEKNI